jgi:2-methylcitrate dehydratase
MPAVDDLGRFVAAAKWEDVPDTARSALKLRLIDALGCAIGALDGAPIQAIRNDLDDFGGNPLCSLVAGGRTAPDDAAFYNSALIRYLDFNDSHLAPGETCHPSDNIGAALAAAQYADAHGRDLLAALAAAYQVHCRLSDEAPVRWRQFDHVTTGSYAAAAGASRALGLNAEETANAVAIAGTALNALRVTRTSLSHWKGLAFPFAAFGATRAAFLARRGVTGPRGVLDGRKGLMEAISGPFKIDWESESLDAVTRTAIKRFNAEIHSQSAVEAVLTLREEHGFDPATIERVDVDTFDVAFSIIGGGDEGQKTEVGTKEEADHSLPYVIAVALLDGELLPTQYAPERIASEDVGALTRRVRVRSLEEFSRRFPAELPTRVAIRLENGVTVERSQRDYEGFHTRPMAPDSVEAKFHRLAAAYADDGLRRDIVKCVHELDERPLSELVNLLEAVEPTRIAAGARTVVAATAHDA